MNQEKRRPGAIPRVAMINDLAGFGRCSTTVALPVISAMKVQVCPVPTSILSNHLGFSTCYFDDYTDHMRSYLRGWEKLGLVFDGLYSGFLGSMEQISIVEELLSSPMMKNAVFLLDPVMGDNGKVYSTVTPAHCSRMKALAAQAHILTPNITEACLLTDTPYRSQGWTDYELQNLCASLACGGSKKIVITGLQNPFSYINYIWENGIRSTCETPAAGVPRPGSGDLFSSILAADAVNKVPFNASVKKAADFTALCIKGSEAAGVPVEEGVLFEPYLGDLIRQSSDVPPEPAGH